MKAFLAQVAQVLPSGMTTVGLRELRQRASDLVRRVESGEEVTITVAGRPSARLVPASARTWRRWDEIADLFDGPSDDAWSAEREQVDDGLSDPWSAP